MKELDRVAIVKLAPALFEVRICRNGTGRGARGLHSYLHIRMRHHRRVRERVVEEPGDTARRLNEEERSGEAGILARSA